MKDWPTPVAPAAALQAASSQRHDRSAGTNGRPFVSGLSPLKGATPAARQSRLRGVRLLTHALRQLWSN